MRTLEKMMRDKERVDAITAEYYRDQKINDRWVYGIGLFGLSCTIVCFFIAVDGILF